jgi:polysaccharide export outer membrane protein
MVMAFSRAVRWLAAAAFVSVVIVQPVVAQGNAAGATAPRPGTIQPAGASATGATSAPAEYRLGGGDVIRISVFQNPDLTLESRVSEAGVISYPLLGIIRIGGLSVTEAERSVADGLRNGNFVKQPQVTIVVLQVRGSQFSVLGQVNRPGRYPIEVADLRLTDALAIAGGTAPGGSDVVVLVGARKGKSFRVEIDLPTVFADKGRDKDLLVENGDTVWIDRQPLVYIYGEVQRPGPLRLERDMTLMQVLATGGGLTARGTDKGIRVHRRDADGSTRIIEMGMTERLRENDVVYVRESLF